MNLISLLFISLTVSSLPRIAAGQGDEPPPAPVVVAIAEKLFVSPTNWFPGVVIPTNDSQLASEETGRLIYIANVGEIIKQGQAVARVDDVLLKKLLISDQAAVTRDRARLAYYNGEVYRLGQLVKSDTVSQNQLDQALFNQAVAESELEGSEARADITRERLRRTSITAPFTGIVTERLTQTGEWAESGRPVIRLVSTDLLEVQTWLPSASLPFVQVGSELKVKDSVDARIGTVLTVVPVGDDTSKLYELRLTLGFGGWPAGKAVQVAIPTGPAKEIVAVDRDALVLRRSSITVYRITERKTAEAVKVITGIDAGQLIEVDGINAGDLVVTRGGERLRPGQSVITSATE